MPIITNRAITKITMAGILLFFAGTVGISWKTGRGMAVGSWPGPLMRRKTQTPMERPINPNAMMADNLNSFDDLGENAKYTISPRSPRDRITNNTCIKKVYHFRGTGNREQEGIGTLYVNSGLKTRIYGYKL